MSLLLLLNHILSLQRPIVSLDSPLIHQLIINIRDNESSVVYIVLYLIYYIPPLYHVNVISNIVYLMI